MHFLSALWQYFSFSPDVQGESLIYFSHAIDICLDTQNKFNYVNACVKFLTMWLLAFELLRNFVCLLKWSHAFSHSSSSFFFFLNIVICQKLSCMFSWFFCKGQNLMKVSLKSIVQDIKLSRMQSSTCHEIELLRTPPR